MKITKATKKDLKESGKLMLSEFSKPPFNEKGELEDVLKSLNFYFKIGEIYVATKSAELIGIIVFKIEQYWEGLVLIIEDLAVKEDFKKQGIGNSLMKFVENYAKKKNIKKILFETNKKSEAIKFYRKRGYSNYKNRISMGKNIK